MLKIIIGEIVDNISSTNNIQENFKEFYDEGNHNEIILPKGKIMKLSYIPISLDFDYIIAFSKYILKLSINNHISLYTNDLILLTAISHIIEPLYDKPEIVYSYKSCKESDLENQDEIFKKYTNLLQLLEDYPHKEDVETSLEIQKKVEKIDTSNLFFERFSNTAFYIYFKGEEFGIIDFQRPTVILHPKTKSNRETKELYEYIFSIFDDIGPDDFCYKTVNSQFLNPKKTKELLKLFLADMIEFEEGLFKFK